MALTKYKLGQLIERLDNRNYDGKYTMDGIKGISTSKEFIDTKANMDGVNLTSYKVVKYGEFAYVADTSRRGEKIAVAFNDGERDIIISSIYTVFYISRKDILLSDYLFMYFNRLEFDRYTRFNSWGSARETFDWDTLCDTDIELPSISVQQKYVNIYKSIVANQQSYECGLEDLKLACDGYIEDLRRKLPCKKIGQYLKESNQRNDIGLTIDSVRGLTTNKETIPTKADMTGVSLNNYKVVNPRQIAYVPDTSRRGDKISLGFNHTMEPFLVSSISIVFGTDYDFLLPDYLMLFLTRTEFDRYTRFNSWGSARETFDWEEMCNVQIPIPDIKVQRAIAEIYLVYLTRKRINEQLKAQIKSICPILIRGSLEEGG